MLVRWTQLVHRVAPDAPDPSEVGSALLASWAEPHRTYHDLRHLRAVLHGVDELAGYAADPDAVQLAAWYHDAVHDGAPDEEERSADRARTELSDLGVPSRTVAEVARLVRLTANHNPAPEDRNGAVLCDADLAILAADAGRYAGYAAAVREEYLHIDEAEFRAGRAAILRDLLARPTLFHTPIGQACWESPARANLLTELASLGQP